MKEELLINQLVGADITNVFYVPCSVLKPYIEACEKKSKIKLVMSYRENVAIGLAVGTQIAGKKAAVMMQNSGLGITINEIASLLIPYKIPLLFVISMRGYENYDSCENYVMGRNTTTILQLLNIKYCFYKGTNIKSIIHEYNSCYSRGNSFAILINMEENIC